MSADAEFDGRKILPLADLRSTGMLWLINRTVFHPRGFALALELDEVNDEIVGWSLLGDGTEVWAMTDEQDDRHFDEAVAFLRQHQP